MTVFRSALLAAVTVLAACAPAFVANPSAALAEAQLRRHLFAFADDSMLGRRAGTEGGLKASRYLAATLTQAGLEPAGENGTFYQYVPLVRVSPSQASILNVAGQRLQYGSDYLLAASRAPLPGLSNAPILYLGSSPAAAGGWPSAEEVRGKVLLIERIDGRMPPLPAAISGAAAVFIVSDLAAVGTPPTVTGLAVASRPGGTPAQPPVVFVSRRVAELVVGGPLAGAAVGLTTANASGQLRMSEVPLPTYNVIAILRGSDPVLRDEYVVIGAHPDHVGTRTPLDHDSLRAVLLTAEALGHARGRRLTGAERAQITVRTDTLVRTGPPRADSVFNGADDDGSGSIAVLALAESFARLGVRPRRSILFIWQHAEELGLLGSRHFSDYPTVPRENLVAMINLDMVGRGRAEDIPGGGPRYVQVVGSRRLSTELGDLVERVNSSLAEPMQFDYSMDADGHPERIYCRSDHVNFARYGIPIVFFTTGLHADYHQLTDEPQYIDYPKLRRVGELAGAVALAIANADGRPVVDKPLPDPFAPCRQ